MPTDPRTLLDSYAAGISGLGTTEQAAPEAIAALRAVLGRHVTDWGNGPDPNGRCLECAEVWPCPTVRAITDAIGGGECT